MAKTRAEFVCMGKEKSTSVPGILIDGKSRRAFQTGVIDWFQKVGKDYPWRRTKDPYAILVSELMLQQTRIQTVLDRGYYDNWMKLFPDCETLAKASESEILKAWEGLGYYNRARNLQKAATMVVDQWGGVFPDSYDSVLSLPGVGRYTAGAVLSFAFGKSYPIVDGNVIRVLARLFGSKEPVDSSVGKSQMWDWADNLTPDASAREYNSGIMELGQQVCVRSAPLCDECPVADWCIAGREKMADSFPVVSRVKKISDVLERVVLLSDSSGEKIWLVPETGTRRKGLWRLPEISEDESLGLKELLRTKYAITRYRVTLIVFQGALSMRKKGGKWFPKADQNALPAMGSPYKKVLEMSEA